ncbi:class F sortase [Kitasatospora sp. NBC_00070]|uniref:class F sortase n=1 Tax=Kitasatospora sp. NBC_00070 TaxID=2975962 RepID=UPI00324722A2
MAALSGVVLLVALAGAAGEDDPGPEAQVSGAPVAAAVRPAAQVTDPQGASPPPGGLAPLAPSTPLRLAIPAIGVDAPLLALGTDDRGRPELPPYSLPGTVGWLRDSPTPGAPGAAVLAGHVDTLHGPAVFWSLASVPAGAVVEITRLDGGTAVFTVDDVRTFSRQEFPNSLVRGPTSAAELRIITCGGRFNRAEREYTGNVILFAHLTGSR